RMPEVAANAPSALLASWSLSENAVVHVGDAMATVETDKAAVDIEADSDGVVYKLLVTPGDTVAVGAPIAVLTEPGEHVANVEALLASLGTDGGYVAGGAHGAGGEPNSDASVASPPGQLAARPANSDAVPRRA